MSVKLELRDIFDFWTKVQRSILHMASLLEENDLNITFDPKLKPIGEIFYHIAGTYNGWLTYTIKDGEENPGIIPNKDLTVKNINESLKNAFGRCNRLLEKFSTADWNKVFIDHDDEGNSYELTFSWILWHLIEHDIHHRAQLKLQYKFLERKINRKIFWEEI